MRAIARDEVLGLARRAGGECLAVDEAEIATFGIASATYWVTRG
jgi:hypothetical protein